MTIVIRPEAARDHARHARGGGGALVDQIGASFADLRADVNEEDLGARRFSAALGSADIGRSERLGDGQPHPIRHLERQLDTVRLTHVTRGAPRG